MSSDLVFPAPRPDGAPTAAEVYGHVADVLSWAAERRADDGATDEAIDLLDAALAARLNTSS